MPTTPRDIGESFGALCRKFGDAALAHYKNPTPETQARLDELAPEYERLRAKYLAACPTPHVRLVKA